jgi:intein/homing endonuclease
MKTLKIKSIKESGEGDVYDITVNKYENYILENGVITHNSGMKYSASTIVYLSKSKEKDGKEVIGAIIRAKTYKSRLSRENQEVETRLYYDERGLDRYYGLLELGEIGGLWKNVAGRYEINGKKIYGKEILKKPEEYFTEEVMQKLDEIAKREFSYGSSS